ncbi:septin-2-like isoform X2 [Clytia hemisphaerica]|uniref:septin-2-like isoform X2 n=1 Tax=Clytia hemisphaerica TaxID=252671 RepID=UPI0034D69AB3
MSAEDSMEDEDKMNRKISKEDAGIYVGFANLPNQVHRKSVKRGFEFTLMVVGESGLGKSTLVDSLFLTSLYSERETLTAVNRIKRTVSVSQSTVEIEEKGVKLKLTVVDTPGFGDSIDNSDSWSPIVSYIDEQYEAYLRDESGLNRRNIIDNRVHCCLYFINPCGHGLKPQDVAVMKCLHDKVNIVPVIAKADTLTKKEVKELKQRILREIYENQIQIYQFPEADEEEDDEEFIAVNKELKNSVPFAVVGSNTVYEVNGKKVRGRIYPWGVVDIENPAHCDFTMLRNMLIRTHMQDLKDVTQDTHYENYRAKKLASGEPLEVSENGGGGRASQELDSRDALLMEKEAELRRMQEMIAKMQASMLQQQQNVS